MWIDDQVLQHYSNQVETRLFIPDFVAVVLGSSNQPDIEVSEEYCAAVKIPVLKRYGGGGTVVLYPGCVVVSTGIWVRQHFQNQEYFRRINQAVIDVLAQLDPLLASLDQRGLSDIAMCGRKIAGTSLFRSRNYLLYQGSIIVEPNLRLITSCLKHPSKEPDYRGGRGHREFMSSLFEICGLTPAQVLAGFEANFADALYKQLEGEIIEPVCEQFPALIARLERAQKP